MQFVGHGSVTAAQQFGRRSCWKKKEKKSTFNAEVILARRPGPLYLHFHHGLLYTSLTMGY